MTERRQRIDPVIKDAQMMVLEKIQVGGVLDSLERSILDSMVTGKIGMCTEVKILLSSMQDSGVI